MERYRVVFEFSDSALSVVLLRRLLKHLGRSYGLKAVSCRREDLDPTLDSSPRARRSLSRGESAGKAS